MAKGDKLAAVDALGIDALCERLIAGESQTAIAESLDVSKATLINWIAADPDRSARAREARIYASHSFDEMAVAEIRAAADPFALAKAKELAYHFRWKASKSNPREFGEKLEIDQKTTLTDLTEDQLNARIARLLNPSG
jgi:transposase